MTHPIEIMRSALLAALSRQPADPQEHIDRSLFLGELIRVRLEHLHMTAEKLAQQTQWELDEIEAILQGFLPAELIDNDLLIAIGAAVELHPNIFRIILNREPEALNTDTPTEIEQIIMLLKCFLDMRESSPPAEAALNWETAWQEMRCHPDDALYEQVRSLVETAYASARSDREHSIFRSYVKKLRADMTRHLQPVHGGDETLLRFRCWINGKHDMPIYFDVDREPSDPDDTVQAWFTPSQMRSFEEETTMIIGAAGSGKTTLMSSCASLLAEQYLEQPTDTPVPVYLNMQHWSAQQTLSSFVADSTYSDVDHVHSLLSQGRCHTFIDGIDALSRAQLRSTNLRHFMESVMETTYHAPITLACRPETYHQLQDLRLRLHPIDNHIYLTSLTRDDIRHYTKKRWGDFAWKYIAKDTNLVTLCGRYPINLWLIMRIILKEKQTYQTRIGREDITSWIHLFYLFIYGHYEKELQTPYRNWLPSPHQLHEVLGRVASYDEHHVQYDMINNLLKNRTDPFIRITMRFGLIRVTGQGSYQFTHPMLARYFKLVFAFLTHQSNFDRYRATAPELDVLIDWIADMSPDDVQAIPLHHSNLQALYDRCTASQVDESLFLPEQISSVVSLEPDGTVKTEISTGGRSEHRTSRQRETE